MTKREANAKLAGFLTTDVPKATSVGSWLVGETAAPMVAEPIAAKVIKPRIVGYKVIRPDPAKGQTFEPYVVLSVANQATGRFHKDLKHNQQDMDALKAFVSVHGWTLPAVPRS